MVVTPAELEHFRQALVARQSELESRIEQDAESSEVVELDQARVGRLSRMDALQAQQMAMASGRRARQELARVRRALGQIESGDYGACAACGGDIDPRRLEIDPATTRCISCAD